MKIIQVTVDEGMYDDMCRVYDEHMEALKRLAPERQTLQILVTAREILDKAYKRFEKKTCYDVRCRHMRDFLNNPAPDFKALPIIVSEVCAETFKDFDK